MKPRDEQHYRKMMHQNIDASVGVNLAARALCAVHPLDWESTARYLRQKHGENVSARQVLAMLDHPPDIPMDAPPNGGRMAIDRIDAFLCRKAQLVWPSALVIECPSGDWVLRRPSLPDIGLGATFRDAQHALAAAINAALPEDGGPA